MPSKTLNGASAPVQSNPFVFDNIADTLHAVSCGLDYLAVTAGSIDGLMKNHAYGLDLILQTMSDALRSAKGSAE